MTYTNYIGFLAATLTTVSFIPQALKIFRTRQTKDISLWMYISFVIGVSLWLVYGIIGHDWPIILANIVTLTLVIPILIFKIIYH
jgi:MtN3 and saliva related transmembrane protein